MIARDASRAKAEAVKAAMTAHGTQVSEGPAASPPPGPALATLVAQAKDDLAKRLAVEPGRIELLEARAVVWPDTSLGCPRPGMEYLQVLREGALVRFRWGKRIYDYHSGSGRAPFLCERPRGKAPGGIERVR